ncbi:hypothetical protein ACRAQ6_10350 [Erythrobacter sp. HA6-11]
MPMNQFLFDHQVAAMKVDRSGSPEERKEISELIGTRAKRIAEWRKANGLSNQGWPRDERESAKKGERHEHSLKRGKSRPARNGQMGE